MHPDSDPKTTRFESPEGSNEYWLDLAKKFVTKQVEKNQNTKKAKNLIFFLGDGMGLTTLAMVRMYMGGEEKKYSFENFPNIAMSKTYCTNAQVADSACSATAYFSGVKCKFL